MMYISLYKMNRLLSKYIAIFLLAAFATFGVAAEVKVTASLDSASILMGRVDTLRLFVDRDAASQGVFPLLHKIAPGGYVTLLNDTLEIGAPRLDTIKREGNRITERLVMPVQVFDSGRYSLPPFVYVTADDSVFSNTLDLEVVPVKVGENDAISDYKDVTDPSDKSFWDFLPDWIYYWWWLWLLIVLALAAGVYFARKYRRTGKFISLPEKPQPKPWTIALQRLEGLKAKNLWENGMEKEYFTQLTDILRDYLSQRFGINAMEMTSRQIMQTLADQTDVRDKRTYVRKILDVADFVKFAKVRPLPADNVEAFDNAVNFVKETIIEEPAEDKKEADGADSKNMDSKNQDSKKKNQKKGGEA